MTRPGMADLSRLGLGALILHVVMVQLNPPDTVT
jgi:hypothetical protein